MERMRWKKHCLERPPSIVELRAHLHHVEGEQAIQHRTRPSLIHIRGVAVMLLDLSVELRRGFEITRNHLGHRRATSEPVQREVNKRIEVWQKLRAEVHEFPPKCGKLGRVSASGEVSIPIFQ